LIKKRTTPETRVIRKNVNAKKNKRLRTNRAVRPRDILVLRGMELKGDDWYGFMVSTDPV